MGNLDYKHVIAAVVGIALGIFGSLFSIDFSKSCPAAPASALVAPAPAASPVK